MDLRVLRRTIVATAIGIPAGAIFLGTRGSDWTTVFLAALVVGFVQTAVILGAEHLRPEPPRGSALPAFARTWICAVAATFVVALVGRGALAAYERATTDPYANMQKLARR